MSKNDVYIYSPSASEPLGHPIYVQQLVKYISKVYSVHLYTLKHHALNSDLIKMGAKLIVNESFVPGGMDKNRFLGFGIFSKTVYGLMRIRYSYKLIKDFYNSTSTGQIFHLLEFEYISCYFFFLYNRTKLKNTILGFHTADFEWIKGRSYQINIYKTLLRYMLPSLIRSAYGATIMGETLKERFISNLKIEKYRKNIHFSGYGNDSSFKDINKTKSREELGIKLDESVRLGLFFGVIRNDKGIKELIDSLKDINQLVYLLIAGSVWDISEDEIKARIKKNDIEGRVILHLGYITENDISKYFSAADFIFLTHKGSFYSFSGPLSLSVEHRRPVVATNVGEIGYFVQRFNLGITYEADNWPDLVIKTNQFIKYQISNSIPEYGFKEAMEYNSWNAVSERIMNIYKTFTKLNKDKKAQ
ncbi:MAG: glycosyltransferase family 4 protein [Bacteroidales bacterium]